MFVICADGAFLPLPARAHHSEMGYPNHRPPNGVPYSEAARQNILRTPGGKRTKALSNRCSISTVKRMQRRSAQTGNLRPDHGAGHGTPLAYTHGAEMVMVALYLAAPSLALLECIRLLRTLTGEHASAAAHSRARSRQGLCSKKMQYWSGKQVGARSSGFLASWVSVGMSSPLC